MSTASEPMSEARIAAYLRDELGASERAAVEAAMDADPQWLGVLALLAAEQDVDTARSSAHEGSTVDRVQRQFSSRLHPGQQVGRFEVLRPLGRGGMGSVYAAYDPQLERDVALKILHASRPAEQPRLVAEARVLAQLNDPQVITVHDIGRWQERVFVAMELLEGQTLRQWRVERPRSWQEVLEVYLDATRGLAAAHEAGIVHRDVKPSNVMITDAGRVVVVDFGLAVEEQQQEFHTPSEGVSIGARTRGGSRAGTPAYMAPEQHRGERATAASDQFSLCVALHEALTGVLPPASAGPERPCGFEACRGVPRRLMRVVERGLSPRTEERHGSMRSMHGRLRAAGNTPLWPVGVEGVGTSVGLVSWYPQAEGPKSCTGAQAELAEVWTPVRRGSVERKLRAPGGEWSETVAATVLARLDTYASTWLTEHTRACEAGKDGKDDDQRLDARMLCLDRRLRRLDVLLEVFETSGPEVVVHAVQAADALPPVQDCAGPDGLSQGRGEQDPQAEEIRDRLAYADVLREAASLDEAKQLVHEALEDTVRRRDASLEAEARLVLGWVEHDRSDYEAAETELRLALAAATVSRHDLAVSKALHRLAWVVGYKRGRHGEGRDLCDRAEAWSTRLRGADVQAASRALTRGWIELDAADFDVALGHFDRAVDLARDASPSNTEATYDLGLALNGVGAAQVSRGDLDAASVAFDRAASLLAARLGAAHPRVAQVLNNRASVLRALGRPEEALKVFERSRRAFVEAYGGEHVGVGQSEANIAVVLNDMGEYDDAIEHADEAIRVLSATSGADHPLVAKSLGLRGDAHVGAGRLKEAERDYHRALSIEVEVLGPKHPSLGITRSNLSIVYDKMGRVDDAVDHQERALEILEAAYGPEGELVATGRMNLAFLERRRGDYPRSLELYQQALEHVSELSRGITLLGTGEAFLLVGRAEDAAATLQDAIDFLADRPPALGSRGEGMFLLAQAKWQLGERAQARALARRAVEVLLEEKDADLEAEVRSWIKSPRAFRLDVP